MKPSDLWKNFELGDEIGVSGTFIYNGLRRFHEMKSLEFTDELFEFLYDLSVGIERLIKIAIVLYEHCDTIDQEELEKSLITHNHLELLARLKKHTEIKLGSPQIELLGLLSTFYKSHRYDRFSLSSVYDSRKERQAIFQFLGKHLDIEFSDETSFFGNPNDDRYRRFIRRTTLSISRVIFEIINKQAHSLNLYTYELRHGSKAESVFLREVDISNEDVLWKELLVFFINTKSSAGYLEFLRSIEPLEFDPALVGDYLECFQSDSGKAFVMDELEHLYEETVNDFGERLEMMRVIGSPDVHFDEEDEDEELYQKESD